MGAVLLDTRELQLQVFDLSVDVTGLWRSVLGHRVFGIE